MNQSKHPRADEISFPELVTALLDEANPFPPAYVYRLSHIDGPEIQELKTIWQTIAVTRRRALLADIESFSDADTLLDFTEVCLISLRDPDPEVRMLSIQAMWEEESARYARHLLALLEREKNIDVKAAGLGALNTYVYRGELDEIPQSLYQDIEAVLMRALAGTEHPLIRRRALEAISYSSDPDIDQFIQAAFQKDDEEWVATALVAMGRSANKIWMPSVKEMFEHPNPVLREEAARAAGGLEMKAAVPTLIKLLEDEDSDVRAAAIWSLSLIGGKGVSEALEEMLETAEDDDEIALVEEAIDNLAFTDQLDSLPLLDLSEEDLADSIYEFDPDEDDEEE